MGKLIYENQTKVDFDDRALAHLQAVITAKLRRGESFTLMWKDDVSIGDGRTAIWLHPQCSLQFKYYGGRAPTLNKAWLEALTYTANSATGLYVVPEPDAANGARDPFGGS
jgi:hypothetical protein